MKFKKWKADEMEMAVNFKAMRIAYVFSIMALCAYCVYEFLAVKRLPSIPFAIVCAQSVLFFISKLFMTGKMTKVNDDEE